jgi:hypothetical protein
MLMARVGGAVGGSGMRVDFANAQLKSTIDFMKQFLVFVALAPVYPPRRTSEGSGPSH